MLTFMLTFDFVVTLAVFIIIPWALFMLCVSTMTFPRAFLRPGKKYDNALAQMGYEEVFHLYTSSRSLKAVDYAIARRLHEIGLEACKNATDPNDPALSRPYGSPFRVPAFRHADELCAEKRACLQSERTARRILQPA